MSWRPTSSLEVLQARSDLLHRLRGFFHDRQFCEVQTPVLGHDTVVDRHLDPIEVPAAFTTQAAGAARQRAFFLQTSPEFSMKRLLAAGMPAIYQIGPAFRAAERGQFHNPEFTMVEWYRVGDDFQQGVQLLGELLQVATHFPSPEQTTYQRAFETVTGCDPLQASVESLASVGATQLDVPRNWSHNKDDWLDLLFAELVQPRLGQRRPAIVTHYPASQSALARLALPRPTSRPTTRSEEQEEPGDRDFDEFGGQTASPSEASLLPSTAERFELFIHGVELANGYHELTDALELEQRNATVNSQRLADGKKALPTASALVEAMQAGLPPCCGCALGLDRLLMVSLGLDCIDQVMPFPIERS